MCEIDWNLIKDIFGMFIATGTTLYVFYKTLNKEKTKEQKNHNKLIKNRLTIFSNLIHNSKIQISQSISNLNENIKKFEKDNLENHLLITSSNNGIERLMSLIKNEDYFLAFIEYYGREKTKNYNNICILTEYFNNQINQILEIKSKHLTYDENRKNEYAKLIEELFFLINEIEDSDSILDKNQKEELQEICSKFNSTKKDITDLNNYDILFVKPFLSSNFLKNNTHKTIKELDTKLSIALKSFERIKIQNSIHCNNLKEISKKMEEFYIKMKEETKEISKLNYS